MRGTRIRRLQSKKKEITFNCGDFVSVKIPQIDRASTDFHCLPYLVDGAGAWYKQYLY